MHSINLDYRVNDSLIQPLYIDEHYYESSILSLGIHKKQNKVPAILNYVDCYKITG